MYLFICHKVVQRLNTIDLKLRDTFILKIIKFKDI